MNLPASDYRCYRHPDREAYISCQRCERLICPECMNDAAVGFQCPSCLAKGAKSVRTPRTMAGAKVSGREGVATLTLIGINVVVFVAQLATGITSGAIYLHGAMLSVTSTTMSGDVLTGVADGGYWRLLTAAFLHLSILHILFNMYALYLFGPFVERALGTVRFVAAYLTMAVASSVFVYWLSSPHGTTAGASGAIFGVFGVAFFLLLRAKQDVRTLLALLAINAFISTQGNISWQGHLGGFISGCVLGAAIAYAPRERRQLVQLLVFVAMWVGIVVAVVARTAQLS
jgi:membrane associated rhomboid family serine protease